MAKRTRVGVETKILELSAGYNFVEALNKLGELSSRKLSGFELSTFDQILDDMVSASTTGAMDSSPYIRSFVATYNSYLSSDAVGNSILTLAEAGEFAALDAVIDNLSDTHLLPSSEGGMSQEYLSPALYILASWEVNGGVDLADDIRSYMEVLGESVTGKDVGLAMWELGNYGKYEALDAIFDNISETHLQNTGNDYTDISVDHLSQVLYTLAWGEVNTEADLADEIRSYMEVLGEYLTDREIASSISELSMWGKFEALDAIIDNISETNFQNLLEESYYVRSGIVKDLDEGLAGLTWYESYTEEADLADDIRSYMEALGEYLTDQYVLRALLDFAYEAKFEAFDAILDNISETHLQNVGYGYGEVAPETLSNILYGLAWWEANGEYDLVDQISSYMEAVGQYMSHYKTGWAMEDLAAAGKLEALYVIVENLSDEAQISFGQGYWSNWGSLIEKIVSMPDVDPSITQDQTNALVRKIMEDLADNPYEDITELVNLSTLVEIMLTAGYNDNLDLIDAITDNLSDDAQIFIGQSNWSYVIELVSSSSETDQANALVREIMEDLADNPYADISDIVNVWNGSNSLASAMENAGWNGNVELIDAITDNLSDEAQLQISTYQWGGIISSVADAPYYNPSVTQDQANALVREILEDLADNPYADISDIVNIWNGSGSLASAMENAGWNGNIDLINVITDNLSDEAQLQISTYSWGGIISSVADAPYYNPEVTQDQANALVREILEDLADNPYADISDIVNIWNGSGSLASAMENAGWNGNIDLIDAITDNLSDEAQLQISTYQWGGVIASVADAPYYNPEVTQDQANALVREILEDLSDNPYADISEIVDISTIEEMLWTAGYNGNLDLIDAITDNLSDEAQLYIDQSSWSAVIESISSSSNTDQANALVRKIMADLADNPYADISQIVDVNTLVYVMSYSAGATGNIDLVDAIADNLSDEAQLEIALNQWNSFAEWGGIIGDIGTTAPLVNPEVTQDQANSLVREIMVDLADNQYADMSQLIGEWGMVNLGLALENAVCSSNHDLIGTIIEFITPEQFDSNSITGYIPWLESYASEFLPHDIAFGTTNGDALYGSEGNDVIYGAHGSDGIFGGGGDDHLFGGADSDYLNGEAGSDTLAGGGGNDYLIGGAGADTFVFAHGEDGVDTLSDFNAGEGDALDISQMLDGFDPLQDAITDFVQATNNENGSVTISIDADGTGTEAQATDVATLFNTSEVDVLALLDSGNIIV